MMLTLTSAGPISNRFGMQKNQAADDLCDQLRQHADQSAFASTLVKVGPFFIRFRTDSICAQLQLTAAFEQTNNIDDCHAADLTVYVMCSPNQSAPAFSSFLASFINASPVGLPALAHQNQAPFVVIKDLARKLLKIYDATNHSALLFIENLSLFPSWERFCPIKEFIHLLALSRSCLLLHAGSVVEQQGNRGILLVGPGGSGKSSLTAFAVSKGMRTNGDDYVLVDLREPQARCWSVYRTLKLHPTSPSTKLTTHFKPWQVDSFTQKTIYLGSGDSEQNCFVNRTDIARIYGVRLRAFNLDLKQGIHASHDKNPYAYTAMSTVQQLPYWVSSTLSFAKALHESVGYRSLTVDDGVMGMSDALHTILEDLHK